MFIIDAIKKLKNSKRTFFTTPTHLRGNILPAQIKNLIGYKAFNADFSEVDGLDNLKNPNNCILKSQKKAAEIYDTKATFYLTQGSSSGILAILLSILNHCDKILIARNAHESVFNALVLTGATPIWFLPDYDKKFDIAKGITLEKIKLEYEKNPDIKAVFITSPTYEGMVSETEKIAEFCKSKNIYFIVDEAHGALFPFSEKLPNSSINFGADACVHSLHKTTPALNGSALLHIGKNSKLNPDIIQKNLNLITTTSPSWLIISSVEASIEFLNSNRGLNEIENLINNIKEFKNNNSNFEFLNNDDMTKIFIKKDGLLGSDFSEFLNKNNIEDELTTNMGVLCLCGIGTTRKKLRRLSHVLEKLPNKFNANSTNFDNISLPIQKLTPKEAFYKNYEIINKENSIGKIIAENITPYPPCVPILMAGEVIEEKHLKYMDKMVKVIKD